MDVDLSKELLGPTKSILQTQVEAARRGRSVGHQVIQSNPLPPYSQYILILLPLGDVSELDSWNSIVGRQQINFH